MRYRLILKKQKNLVTECPIILGLISEHSLGPEDFVKSSPFDFYQDTVSPHNNEASRKMDLENELSDCESDADESGKLQTI